MTGKLCRHVKGASAPVDPFDAVHVPNRFQEPGADGIGSINAGNVDVGGSGGLGHQEADKIHQNGKAQKQDDAEGEGAGQQDQIFSGRNGVMYTQRGFNPDHMGRDGVTYGSAVFQTAGNRSGRRHLRGPLRRSTCSDQNRHDAHHNTAYDSDDADTEKGNVGKFFPHKKAQGCAQPPGAENSQNEADGNRCFAPVQGLQSDKTDDLPAAHPDAAHHSKKLRPLGHAAVDAS